MPTGALARRTRAHMRPTSPVCPGGGRRIVGAGTCRSRRPRSQARIRSLTSARCCARWDPWWYSAPAIFLWRSPSLAETRLRPWRRQHRDREGACGSSGHERTGGTRDTGERPRMRLARRSVLASVRQRPANWDGADEASAGEERAGFTGSRAAGRILMDVAASRPEPIPFYAEMSSTNPVFVLPGALRERGETYRDWTCTDPSLWAPGQFCTKPGMVFLPEGSGRRAFAQEAAAAGWRHRTPFHLADQGNSLFVRLRDCSSQEGNGRQTRGRGSETRRLTRVSR